MSEVRGAPNAKGTKRTRGDDLERTASAAVDALRKMTERSTRATESSERYQLVAHGADYRLGIDANERTGLVSIELLVCVLPEDIELEVGVLASILRIAKVLRDRGYALAHQGDGWISCDRSISWRDTARECGTLLGLLDENGFGRASTVRRRAEGKKVNKEV